MRSRVAAARLARRPSASHSTTRVFCTGTAVDIWNSKCRLRMRLESEMWVVLYSPGSRTSIRANGDCPASRLASAAGDRQSTIARYLQEEKGLLCLGVFIDTPVEGG